MPKTMLTRGSCCACPLQMTGSIIVLPLKGVGLQDLPAGQLLGELTGTLLADEEHSLHIYQGAWLLLQQTRQQTADAAGVHAWSAGTTVRFCTAAPSVK